MSDNLFALLCTIGCAVLGMGFPESMIGEEPPFPPPPPFLHAQTQKSSSFLPPPRKDHSPKETAETAPTEKFIAEVSEDGKGKTSRQENDLSYLFRPLVVFDVRLSPPILKSLVQQIASTNKDYHIVLIDQNGAPLEEATKLMLLAPYTLFVALSSKTKTHQEGGGSVTLYTNTPEATPAIDRPHIEENMPPIPPRWLEEGGGLSRIRTRLHNVRSAMFVRFMLERLAREKTAGLFPLALYGHMSYPLPFLNFPLSMGMAILVEIEEPNAFDKNLWVKTLKETLNQGMRNFLPLKPSSQNQEAS